MRALWRRRLIAGTLAVAAGLALAVAPAIVGFTLAIAAAFYWCFYLDVAAGAASGQRISIVSETISPLRETVYVFGRTSTGTRRAKESAARVESGERMKMVMFVIHEAAPDTPDGRQRGA